jgi:hypothetical protein
MSRAPAGYGRIESIELHEFLREEIARLPPGIQVSAFGAKASERQRKKTVIRGGFAPPLRLSIVQC